MGGGFLYIYIYMYMHMHMCHCFGHFGGPSRGSEAGLIRRRKFRAQERADVISSKEAIRM